MKLLLRILVPFFVLGLAFGIVSYMVTHRPEPVVRPPLANIQAVDATRLKRQPYQVIISSYGTVKPRTESTLKPEVSGRILTISPNFRDGGFFEEGDELVVIDPRDYETAVIVAEATLAQRESTLQVEQAQHEQAVENWRLLGDGGKPNPLTLREPQLAEAKANVESARARVEEAKRNLQRTRITAPYAGRILKKEVDVGQVVSPGNTLASIFAVDYVEIRLPLFNEQMDFIDLPETYRGEESQRIQGPKVILKGTYGNREVNWEGQIIRAEGAFDSKTRQLFIVAQVQDPYARTDAAKPPLKVGQFVEADILGRLLENVFIIPRSAVRDGREVLLIDSNKKIIRRLVNPIWRDDEFVVVTEGLTEGDILCTTPILFAAEGAEVLPTVDGVPPASGGPRGEQGGPRGGGRKAASGG